jgi:transcriptional regulator with XRE-family HTH domain
MADPNPVDPVDRFVGNVIRARRMMAGVSQDKIAQAIGVSFQQVQKYERGANRVSASMLQRIATFLKAPIATFFPEPDAEGLIPGFGAIDKLATVAGGSEIAELFASMGSGGRAALLQVAQIISDNEGDSPGPAYVTGGDEAPRHVA